MYTNFPCRSRRKQVSSLSKTRSIVSWLPAWSTDRVRSPSPSLQKHGLFFHLHLPTFPQESSTTQYLGKVWCDEGVNKGSSGNGKCGIHLRCSFLADYLRRFTSKASSSLGIKLGTVQKKPLVRDLTGDLFSENQILYRMHCNFKLEGTERWEGFLAETLAFWLYILSRWKFSIKHSKGKGFKALYGLTRWRLRLLIVSTHPTLQWLLSPAETDKNNTWFWNGNPEPTIRMSAGGRRPLYTDSHNAVPPSILNLPLIILARHRIRRRRRRLRKEVIVSTSLQTHSNSTSPCATNLYDCLCNGELECRSTCPFASTFSQRNELNKGRNSFPSVPWLEGLVIFHKWV